LETLTADIKVWSQTTCSKSVIICQSTVEKFKDWSTRHFAYQLIGLIREVKPDDKDAILKDLRLTSFWHVIECGDNARNSIEYWQDKVPNCFKGQPDVLDNCVNAFRYMKLVNPKRAPSFGTRNCSAQFKVSRKKRKLPVEGKNIKVDDWLVKVRVVDEKRA